MFKTHTEGLQTIQRQALTHVALESKLYVPVGGKRTTSPDEPPFDLLEAVQQFLVFEEPTSPSSVAGHSIDAKEGSKVNVDEAKEEREAKESAEVKLTEGISKTQTAKETHQEAKKSSAPKGDYRKVLLLRGDAGSGKSSFCQNLQTQL